MPDIITSPPQVQSASIQPDHHSHFLLMFGISILAILAAIGGSGYYFLQSRTIKQEAVEQVTQATSTPVPTEIPTPTPTPTPSAEAIASTPTPTPAAPAGEVKTVTKEVAADLVEVNIEEIKAAVAELKTAMASFQ